MTMVDAHSEVPHAARAIDHQRVREDRLLFERFADKRDPIAREILVERFLPLARSLASRYRRPGEPFDDIFQVACIGLVNAIDRYDLSRGRAFSSFAVPTIAGEIKRYYRDKTWAVHVPRDLQELAVTVDRAARELETELGRKPTVDQLAERLAVSDEDVLEALHAAHGRRATSLDAPVTQDDDSVSLGDAMGTHDDGFHRAEQRAELDHLTAILTRRDRRIVALRFQEDLTQEQIGRLIGLSQMQISRILRQAITKVRAHAVHQSSNGAATNSAIGPDGWGASTGSASS
jgi:RNA polymerase sigma-B factor